MRPRPGIVLALAGASSLIAPAAFGATTATTDLAPTAPLEGAPAVRAAALDAAAGWRDSLEAYRAPRLPTPGDQESVILVLADPPSATAAPADRAAAAAAITTRQDALIPTLNSLGATVTFRYRTLIDAIAISLPAGRLDAIAALPQVIAVVPVTYLAPAQVGEVPATAPIPPGTPGPPPVAPSGRPLHIALIDAGIDAAHPWLGGGIGPTFPIVGGADLVDGDDDPAPGAADPAAEAHGTQMASLVLRSASLTGLAPADVPRLLAYRVVAPEPVGGRLRPLARTDRVLAGLERAVDPDGDGDTSDGAEVILLGVADGFSGGGVDPLAEALAAADRVGATVVAPAGNDGPTFARPGSVGGAAAGPTVIAVGGLSAGSSPRTAALDARLGPAAARLAGLPLMGAEPAGAPLPVVVLRDDAGISTGGTAESFADAAGVSRVAGALVVVARGSGSIAETAARASAAGAAAVAIWDEDGLASFPAVPGDGGLALPVVGLGARQGAALVRLAGTDPAITVAIHADPIGPATPTVASFSSWGPTSDGRQKPDLIAPAVDRAAAWPGPGPDGAPRSAPLTGTSAAAAEVAAVALRLRIDHPEIGPRAVQALLVQTARPLAGVATQRQGAGVVATPAFGPLRIEPAIVTSHRRGGATVANLWLSSLDGGAGTYLVSFAGPGSEGPLAEGVQVSAAGGHRLTLSLPSADPGRIIVRDAAGAVVASAPVLPYRPARTPGDALGRPEVTAGARLAEARVRVGLLRREDGRVRNVRMHGIRLALLPEGGGTPLGLTGRKQDGALAAGTYRFLIARRLASGLDVPAGRYRLRVSATGPDGTRVQTVSAPFRIR